MTKLSLTEAFNKAYGVNFLMNPNFMTPTHEEFRSDSNYHYEVASGEWVTGKIYGVTIVTVDGKKTDLSKGIFESMEEVNDYILGLNKPTNGNEK